jgi:hypothetical protein
MPKEGQKRILSDEQLANLAITCQKSIETRQKNALKKQEKLIEQAKERLKAESFIDEDKVKSKQEKWLKRKNELKDELIAEISTKVRDVQSVPNNVSDVPERVKEKKNSRPWSSQSVHTTSTLTKYKKPERPVTPSESEDSQGSDEVESVDDYESDDGLRLY